MAEENQSVESTIWEIRRNSRKKHSAEEKVRIVLEGLRGEVTIAEFCRIAGIHPNISYTADLCKFCKRRCCMLRILMRSRKVSTSFALP